MHRVTKEDRCTFKLFGMDTAIAFVRSRIFSRPNLLRSTEYQYTPINLKYFPILAVLVIT